jgi:CDP-glucose 4,6-dehydratase
MFDCFYKKNVLITGHTGFKGSWLSAWLYKLGAKVTGVALEPPSSPSHFEAAQLVELQQDFRVDIRDSKALEQSVISSDPDFVFHLAAQPLVGRAYLDPVETYQTNVLGTLHLLEALRNLKKKCIVVLITSDKCYDNVEWVWGYRETDVLGGHDPYSASKGAVELVIRSHIKSFFPKNGLIHIAVGRAGNVIGGGDWGEGRIVPDSVRSTVKGDAVLLRNPYSTRPWQHVLEPLSGYLTLASELNYRLELHGEPFNFGPLAETNRTVLELVKEMSENWDLVKWEENLDIEEQNYEAGLLKLNCDKALHHLSWRALLSFKESVQMTAEWYREFYEKNDNIREITFSQIEKYIKIAEEKGIAWAQKA